MANISAAQVKALRDRTGAGMMDCKKALQDADGDEEKAMEDIQKKGLAKVAKKAGAIAAEGMVHAYIHAGSRVGVLLEVNCQTDFVARNEDFKQFVSDVAMQIASMTPLYVRESDIPEADVAKQSSSSGDGAPPVPSARVTPLEPRAALRRRGAGPCGHSVR